MCLIHFYKCLSVYIHCIYSCFVSSQKCLSLFSVGRNCILLSLCPQIFGMYVIKLAVAMVLAGGVQRMDSSGTKVRGMSFPHFLCVGMVLSSGHGKDSWTAFIFPLLSVRLI